MGKNYREFDLAFEVPYRDEQGRAGRHDLVLRCRDGKELFIVELKRIRGARPSADSTEPPSSLWKRLLRVDDLLVRLVRWGGWIGMGLGYLMRSPHSRLGGSKLVSRLNFQTGRIPH